MSANTTGTHQRWAHFRFAVVGHLLAAPPARGVLQRKLRELADREWEHPVTGEPTRFKFSTVERWYYDAKHAPVDPVSKLRRKIRRDAGEHPSVSSTVREQLQLQHREHPGWTGKLHYDNLVAQLPTENVPAYATVQRYLRGAGMLPQRGLSPRATQGEREAARRKAEREVRSYEASHVGGLWHADFHHGSLKVLLRDGTWATPVCLCVLDDRSRLCCHAQWYLGETTENLCHGFSQAVLKRGLPRALLTDNGSAMVAAETVSGLRRMSVTSETTLAHSPYQNGKQEAFWGTLEKRLMALMENLGELTLQFLNEATQAWVEMEYHREVHSETGTTPLKRFLDDPSVLRPALSLESLKQALRHDVKRTQRQSDGTVSIEGERFEIPARYRVLSDVTVRYARFDLGLVHLVDERNDSVLCRIYPVDKGRNADGKRRLLRPTSPPTVVSVSDEPPALLNKLLQQYAATGVPPAFLPKDDLDEEEP